MSRLLEYEEAICQFSHYIISDLISVFGSKSLHYLSQILIRSNINDKLFQGSLEDQLSRLREYEEAIYQFKPHLEELERINQQIQESFVFENRYTQYTMETLRVGWEQLVTQVLDK